ncbi:VOC family protein [Vogesella sp. LIG4]|uniref:VOC family protein n=1 Tax=Vogesella sp. LIG4 TaxID=1192162 RepID=UPI00081F76FE|nr:VOC family protein [Vogesella sp. LIG4]SCK27676.1 Catechol 2,3-dioxygenase [Vogesella sp. LIG4]
MIAAIDHIVLTTADLARCIAFYRDVLGMTLESFVGGTPPVERLALKFGSQKINLHLKGREFEPKALLPTPGALDLCFVASLPLEQVAAQLKAHGVAIEEGPVPRTGAMGRILSLYVRDPDGNLVEISSYQP